MKKNGKKTGSKRTISPLSGADATATQFKNGNRAAAGKGRPPTKKVKDLINEALGDGGIREIIKSLYCQAKKGNVQASKLIIETRDGKPKQEIGISSCDESNVLFEIVDAKNKSKSPAGST